MLTEPRPNDVEQLFDADRPAIPALGDWVLPESAPAPAAEEDCAGLLLVQVLPVAPEMHCEDLLAHFAGQDARVQALPVVRDGRPVGLVSRAELVDKFSRLYFREIYGRKPITEVMNARPVVVERSLGLDELSRLVSEGLGQGLSEGFIITDRGRYLGMGTGQALLRELTERKEALLASALERARAGLLAAQAELIEKQRMERELSIAHEIQAALLPRELPRIPGYQLRCHYQPAQEVGGDYYDFIELPGSLVGLVVADVSGKGVPGSLGMAMARAVLRAQALRHPRPQKVLRECNAALLPDLRSGMFITALYAVLNPSTHRLHCSSAGHMPALYWGPRLGVRSVGTEGMALGLALPADYHIEEREAALEPGDLLVFYTDGVTEAMDPEGQEYGEARFAESLGRHAPAGFEGLLPALMADIAAFTRGCPQSDDITIVLLRREASRVDA